MCAVARRMLSFCAFWHSQGRETHKPAGDITRTSPTPSQIAHSPMTSSSLAYRVESGSCAGLGVLCGKELHFRPLQMPPESNHDTASDGPNCLQSMPMRQVAAP